MVNKRSVEINAKVHWGHMLQKKNIGTTSIKNKVVMSEEKFIFIMKFHVFRDNNSY